tara:strand:+ start:3811 stop:4002 length:192 start_codon:yes stop_codon:yes gene_type:complete
MQKLLDGTISLFRKKLRDENLTSYKRKENFQSRYPKKPILRAWADRDVVVVSRPHASAKEPAA